MGRILSGFTGVQAPARKYVCGCGRLSFSVKQDNNTGVSFGKIM